MPEATSIQPPAEQRRQLDFIHQLNEVVANPPANALSFAVADFLHKSTTAPLQVEIDGLYVRPASEIFTDRFEIGESCRWTPQDQP